MSKPSVFARAWQRLRASAGLDINDDRLWWPTSTLGGKAGTGEWITADSAMALATYYACIRNIADDFGKLPTFVFNEDANGNKEKARKHPVYQLLHDRPNLHMGAMAFKQLLVHWSLGWGRGAAEIEFDGSGRPVGLWPIHPSRISLTLDAQTRSLYYDVRVMAGDLTQIVRLPSERVFDLHGLGPDGTSGYALGVQARESVALGLAANRYATRFYANDATPSIVLVHPKDIKNDAMELIRARWAELYRGADKAHNMAILQGGMEVKQLNIDPEKAQLLLTRQYNVKEICSWFRMPLSKVQYGESNFSNVEAENASYYPDTIQPLCTEWDQEARWKLLDDSERERMTVETNMDAQLRGLPLTRANVQRTRIFAGTMTVNEARKLENENAVGPEGDELWFPLNMQSLRKAYENIDNPPPPSAPAFRPGNPDSGEDPNPDPTNDDRPDTSQDRSRLAEIFRPLFEEAAGRCVEKQAKAVERRSAEKPEPWLAWSRKFFAEQEDYWCHALMTVAGRYQLALKAESPVFDWSSLTETFARDAQLAHRGGTTSALVARWRSELAPMVAEAVMREVEAGIHE